MKPLITVFGLCFIYLPVLGQISEDDANAIRTLLLDEKVANEIFVYYDEKDRRGAYQLPPGNYAFVCPDTTFQKIYPSIVKEFPYSIATDGLLNLRTLYKDSDRGIYIKGAVRSALMIVFREINLGPEAAKIVFFTTALGNQKRFKDRYVEVTGNLQKRKGQWLVRHCDVRSIEWVEYFKRDNYKR